MLAPSASSGAPSSFELDLKELERQKPAIPRRKAPTRHREDKGTSNRSRQDEAYEGKLVRYTVKSGDHIFRILMKEFGMSNDAAERLIPTVTRINNIGDIRKLSVGQVLLIPAQGGGEKITHAKRLPAKQAPATLPADPASTEVDAPSPIEATSPRAIAIEKPETPVKPPPQEPSQITPPTSPAQPDTPSPSPSVPNNVLPIIPVKNLEIPAGTPEEMVDSVLKALGVETQKKRIVDYNGDSAAATSFSIKVDRYVQENGVRIIINCTPKDQFNYTLLRLLENEGYRVVMADGHSFKDFAGALLTQLGRHHSYAIRQVRGKDIAGYLVGDGKEDSQLFLSESAAAR